MSHRIPCFDKIRDFSAFQNYLYSFSPKLPSQKKLIENTTQTSDKTIYRQLRTRSLKNTCNNLEISFEKDFILEHIEAFDFATEKYLQQMFEDIAMGVSGFKNQRLFPIHTQGVNDTNLLKQYLLSQDSLLGVQETKMFMEDIIYEEKLYEFLTYVCSKSCYQVALQLIYIGNMAWEEYLKIGDQGFDYQELIEYAKNLVESFYKSLRKHKSIKFFTLQNTVLKPTLPPPKKQQKVKQIVSFLIVTIFLILSQYFQNPFYDARIGDRLQKHQFFNNISSLDSDENFSQNSDEEEFRVFCKGKKRVKLPVSDFE